MMPFSIGDLNIFLLWFKRNLDKENNFIVIAIAGY